MIDAIQLSLILLSSAGLSLVCFSVLIDNKTARKMMTIYSKIQIELFMFVWAKLLKQKRFLAAKELFEKIDSVVDANPLASKFLLEDRFLVYYSFLCGNRRVGKELAELEILRLRLTLFSHKPYTFSLTEAFTGDEKKYIQEIGNVCMGYQAMLLKHTSGCVELKKKRTAL